MNFEELRIEIKKYMQLLPSHRTTRNEAEDLASKFLVIQDDISDTILELELTLNEVKAVGTMLYNNALIKSEAKNATEKKAAADADPEYLEAEKDELDTKAMIMFLKSKLSIFNDAHLLARNIGKGD